MAALSEHVLRIGPNDSGSRVLIVPPLFEEANRTRRTLVLTMRALAERGIGSMLPDLPGQNESLVATAEASLSRWRAALAEWAASETDPVVTASVRGGALIDDAVTGAAKWRLAPATGASLLRALLRTQIASDRENGVASSIDGLLAKGEKAPLMLAGNQLSPAMVAELQTAEPAPCAPLRTVQLGEDGDAVAGSPLWLRAEPGEDAAMADAIAADIANWMQACGQR